MAGRPRVLDEGKMREICSLLSVACSRNQVAGELCFAARCSRIRCPNRRCGHVLGKIALDFYPI